MTHVNPCRPGACVRMPQRTGKRQPWRTAGTLAAGHGRAKVSRREGRKAGAEPTPALPCKQGEGATRGADKTPAAAQSTGVLR